MNNLADEAKTLINDGWELMRQYREQLDITTDAGQIIELNYCINELAKTLNEVYGVQERKAAATLTR